MLPEPRLRDFAGILVAWGAILLGVVILVIAINLIGCGPSPSLEAGTTPIDTGELPASDLGTMRCGNGYLFCSPPVEACVLRNAGVTPDVPMTECVLIPEPCQDDPRCECMEEIVCPGFHSVCYYVEERPFFYGCIPGEVT